MNRAAAAIFLMLLCSACPKRIDFGPAGEVTDPQVLLRLVDEREARVVTLEADARLKIESPQGSGTVGLFAAIARPALLHLATVDFFGRPIAVLVSNGERFGLYQVEENRYYRGPASPENVSRFLPVVLPADELVALMLGEVPRIPSDQVSLRFDADEGVYRVTLRAPPAVQALEVHPTYHRVLRSEVRGVPAYDLVLRDLQTSDNWAFPTKIKLIASTAETSLELRYTEVSLNGPPDLTLFELVPPEGAEIVEVDAAGQELPRMVPPLAPPP